MVIYMGVIQLPEISLYWNKKKLYCGTIIPKTIDRDKFQILTRMLANSFPSISRLAKIYSLMDKLIQIFKQFIPSMS